MTRWSQRVLKFLAFVVLASVFISCFVQSLLAGVIVFLSWSAACLSILGMIVCTRAWLEVQRRLAPPKDVRVPRGEVARIKRPRGIRTER